MKKIVLAAALVLSLAFIASAHAQSAPQCVVNYFTTSSNSISYGTSVSISWNTSNCSTVSVYGGSINNSNYLPTTGSIQTNPIYNTTTFTLNASGNYNSAPTQNLTIFVNNQNNYQQYYNNTYQTYTPCVISSFSASPVSVVSGNSTTLTWNTVGCTTVTLTGPNISNTNQIPNGSISTGALYGPATYILNASGNNSNYNPYVYPYQSSTTDSKSIMVFVSQPAVVAPSVSVVTGAPTNLSSTSARLNGYVTQSSSTNTQVFFQWGATPSMIHSTQIQNAGTISTGFYDTIYNLYPDTTYYYRAGVTTSNTTTYGEIKSFSTPAAPVVAEISTTPVPPVITTPIVSTIPPAIVSPETTTLPAAQNTNSNIAGLALFGNSNDFWPTSLAGWLVTILAILGLVYMGRMIYPRARVATNIPMPRKNGSMNGNGNGGLSYTPVPSAPEQTPHYEEMDVPIYGGEE